MYLRNATALITGGAQGFGKGFAAAVLEAGGKVSLLDIATKLGLDSQNEFNKKFGSGSALFIKCDVSKSQELEDAFKKTHDMFGSIDLVVNNAGIATLDMSKWERTIDINLTAVIRGSFLAAKYMSSEKGGKGGHIINISSAAGLAAAPFDPVYAASKHGVVGLSRSLALILQPQKIRVNCLCPMYADTALVQDSLKQLGKESKDFASAIGGLQLMTVPDVVAAFVKLIEEPDTTGSVVHISTNGIKYRYQPSKL